MHESGVVDRGLKSSVRYLNHASAFAARQIHARGNLNDSRRSGLQDGTL